MRPGEENPAAQVERLFADIAATRMAGLPICNPALRVEAVGFRAWGGHWLGVLVTPWAVNLMLLPGGGPGFRVLGLDECQRWVFPSGECEFMGGADDALGAFQMCSLFSPAFEFADQDSARATAEAALRVLLTPPQDTESRPGESLRGTPLSAQPLSRRDFLRGARRRQD